MPIPGIMVQTILIETDGGLRNNLEAQSLFIQLYEEKRLAADVTKDGQVKAADALNILKIAVKFSTAPEMEWLSLPKSVGSESMSRTHVVWPNSPIPVTLDMDQDVNLIGIVEDDVDGSWSAVG